MDESIQEGVTEIFHTQIRPENDEAFKKWLQKIGRIEANFPGFRGVYFEITRAEEFNNWTTRLQFDSVENLDHWLKSPQRKALIEEVQPLIKTIDTQRVFSPYAGWFSIYTKDGSPPIWKETMLILMGLYPIVMLEFMYLLPHLKNLNLAVATFIGNAISVSLISWPIMPVATKILSWWLSPRASLAKTILGTVIVLLIYVVSIFFFL